VPVDDNLLRLVVDQVSGNPLNLRLAADLIRREGPATITSRRARRRLLFDLRSEQVQGVLYRRILDHVDPSVRPLANPGLVLRRITADVIQNVLAQPCGLKDVTPARAARLFDLLRGEVSLVSEVRPGVLVHRADVRREMLPLLEMEDSGRVEDIHKRAVRYYSKRTEVDDRIEELYHRLMVGESTETLDRHWDASAAPFLEDAWDELPSASRVYLAGRLGVEADPEDLREADQTRGSGRRPGRRSPSSRPDHLPPPSTSSGAVRRSRATCSSAGARLRRWRPSELMWRPWVKPSVRWQRLTDEGSGSTSCS
jgi:hypothetical protein